MNQSPAALRTPRAAGLAGHKRRIAPLADFLATCGTVSETVHVRGDDGGRAEPLAGETDFLYLEFTPPTPGVLTDLLDTMAGQARQYIAIDGTHWPELADAIHPWCRRRREWSAVLHRPVAPGLTVLRRDPNYVPPPGFGPGTELKGLLESIGIQSDPSCDCLARMEQMDRWGFTGCREHREAIIGWLKEGQERWGWREKVAAAAKAVASGLALRLSLADPFGSLVDEAIRLADKETTGEKAEPATGGKSASGGTIVSYREGAN